MKKVFGRGALLIELEELSKKSANNIDFIEKELANPDKLAEVIFPRLLQVMERIGQERRRIKTRQRLVELSREIAKTLKRQMAGEKFAPLIRKWCKHMQVKNQVKSVWELLTSIQDLFSVPSSEK
eukprot:TRINITY_DN9316_c0_g2_i1.p2 TRINITY_DN9316_c0_g2~~TRINITY_DN9316_c0_g2_i1.p2  ORF type:complete len:125 (-),score=30.67 TRINITY_DN9316_c0_g2_i1:190-564(-)